MAVTQRSSKRRSLLKSYRKINFWINWDSLIKGYSNFSKEECQVMSSLTNDTSIVIKKADKRSCVVVWDSEDCKADPENQLGDRNVYKDINFKEKFLQE